MTPEEIAALREQLAQDSRALDELSGVVLEALLGRLLDLDPKVVLARVPLAGWSLLLALGQFLGEFGHRHVSPEHFWASWTSPAMKEMFLRGVTEFRNRRS